MNTKEMLQSGHHFIVNAIEALPEADWYLPGVTGEWSLKDLIAHLASFELVLNESLKALIDNAPAPTAHREAADPQAFNETEVARRKGRSARTVWGEYEGTHIANLRLVERVPDESMHVRGSPEWIGEAHDLEDFIAQKILGHKREHGAQIQIFKDQLSAARMRNLSPDEIVAGETFNTALAKEFDLNQVNTAMMSRLIHWIEA